MALNILLRGPHQTDRLGAMLARALCPGDTVLLSGPVGAGKSHLARALVQAAQRAAGQAMEDVPSPTYTLVQTYDIGGEAIVHADLYRLTDPAEAEELGLIEAFGRDLCLVEWPDRLGDAWPGRALSIALGVEGDSRRAHLSGDADTLRRVAAALETDTA